MPRVLSSIATGVKGLARPLVGTTTHVETGERVAALTFDDGPHPQHTPRVLDVLERHGARATFFMVGTHASRHPDIVERAAAEGHAIGNHSWTHPSFAFISSRERRRQVQACAQSLDPHGLRLFRSPWGHQTPRSVLDVRALGYQLVGWSIDPGDYDHRSADEIAAHVLDHLRPGSVILLHDALYDRPASDRSPTIAAVERVLAAAEGFRFVTVPTILGLGRRVRIHSFWKPDHDPVNDSLPPAT